MEIVISIKGDVDPAQLVQVMSAINGPISVATAPEKKTRKKAEAPTESEPEQEPESEPETTTATDLTADKVRASAAAKAKGGKRAEVKALIKEMGYDNLPDMPAGQYPEFMEKLEAL